MKLITDKNKQIVEKLLSGKAGEAFQGKQVVIMGGQVHVLPENDGEAVALVEKLEKKYPDQIPQLVFVPRPETYIL